VYLLLDEPIINLVEMYGYQHKKLGLTKHAQTLIRPQLLNAMNTCNTNQQVVASHAHTNTHIRSSFWVNGSVYVCGMSCGCVHILNRHAGGAQARADFGCVVCSSPVAKQAAGPGLIGSLLSGLMNTASTQSNTQPGIVAVSGTTLQLSKPQAGSNALTVPAAYRVDDVCLHTVACSLDSNGELSLFDGIDGQLLASVALLGGNNANSTAAGSVVSGSCLPTMLEYVLLVDMS
jgi:hypothetical protein